METVFDIYDIADKAARTVLGKHASMYTAEDWEDAHQEALCGILSSPTKTEAGLVAHAKYAIMSWLHRWNQHRSAGSIDIFEEVEAAPREVSTTFDPDALRQMLIDVQVYRPNARVLAAIDTEIEYLRLKCAGYSVHGIMMEMGIDEGRLGWIRNRVRKDLELIANGAKREKKPYPKGRKKAVRS